MKMIADEMDAIKFRYDTMVCGTTKRTLFGGVIDLDSDLWCDYTLSHLRVINSLVQITQNC